MDSVLNSLVVTGMFLAMAAGVGIRLGRSGKPYGFAKLALHIILSYWYSRASFFDL
jgi:hypothetical protein